jgi:hypothetical protein
MEVTMADMIVLENRIDVHDHCEAGKYIIDWTLGHREQPKSLDEFKQQLEGIVTVPDRYKDLQFVQSSDDTLVIRLPERSLLQESVTRAQELDRRNAGSEALSSVYGIPSFYADLYGGTGRAATLTELLRCRIGDYTIASCK